MADTYRKEYKPLTEEQKQEALDAKTAAESVEAVFNRVVGTGADPRLIATAKTYLEIAVLLAVKGITAPRPENQAAAPTPPAPPAPTEDRGAEVNPGAAPAAPTGEQPQQ
jgi:hypothetical protein